MNSSGYACIRKSIVCENLTLMTFHVCNVVGAGESRVRPPYGKSSTTPPLPLKSSVTENDDTARAVVRVPRHAERLATEPRSRSRKTTRTPTANNISRDLPPDAFVSVPSSETLGGHASPPDTVISALTTTGEGHYCLAALLLLLLLLGSPLSVYVVLRSIYTRP